MAQDKIIDAKDAPKEKPRDLSKYTVPHLKKMRADAKRLIDQIDEALQAREDDADESEASKMSGPQFERWARRRMGEG